MLGGSARTLLLGAVALGCTVAPVAARGGHHKARYPRYYSGGYTAAAFYYGPGYAPGVVFGFSRYPVAVGFSSPLGSTDPRGSIRTLVEPRDTEVFIDGYYAGVVDDFDGSLQGLRLEPGPHTVTLYREGFRACEETVYSTLGATVKLRHEMEALLPGETPTSRPSPGGVSFVAPKAVSAPAPTPPPPAAVTASDYGTLVLRASPPDAEISDRR